MTRLVVAFNLYRKIHNITLTEIGRTLAIDKSTMTRFAQGKGVDVSTFMALFNYLLQEHPASVSSEERCDDSR